MALSFAERVAATYGTTKKADVAAAERAGFAVQSALTAGILGFSDRAAEALEVPAGLYEDRFLPVVKMIKTGNLEGWDQECESIKGLLIGTAVRSNQTKTAGEGHD